MTLEERFRITDRIKEVFFSRIQYNSTTYCWEWLGVIDKVGYGSYGYSKRGEEIVHRLSWLIFRGEIPAYEHVLHRCDNRKCCNPFHLFTGFNSDNVKDRLLKGRSSKSLTDEEVCKIRELYASEQYLQKELAKMFFCSRANICMILNNKSRNTTAQSQT